MPLSNDYTAIKTWQESIVDFPDGRTVVLKDTDKFNILNRAQNLAQGLVADVVAESYMTDLTPVFDNASKVGSSGMSWTASTRTLTATMSVAFASTDEGKWVDFFDSTDLTVGYGGTVQTYVSATSVIVQGDNLPASNIAVVSNLNVIATTPSGDALDISAARILRAGTQNRIKLLSTLTGNVDLVNDVELQQFRLTYYAAQQNKNRIVWNLVGVNIYLGKGSNLSSYGTLTFRYPRLPNVLTLDADYMDVLDGSMMQLTICLTKSLIAKRLGEKADYKEEMASYVMSIYRQFNGEMSVEEAAKKFEGLI